MKEEFKEDKNKLSNLEHNGATDEIMPSPDNTDGLKKKIHERLPTPPSNVKRILGQVECNLCNGVFSNEVEYKDHIKNTDHGAVGPYVCYLCGTR